MKKRLNNDYLKQISKWKYNDEYEVYNLPSIEEMKSLGYSIVNEDNFDNYTCYLEGNGVVAYSSFKIKDGYVYLGIGLRPDLCGKGLGNTYLTDSVNDALKRFKLPLRLEVRSWNKRAIRSYEKIGFVIVDKVYNETRNDEFIIMEYK